MSISNSYFHIYSLISLYKPFIYIANSFVSISKSLISMSKHHFTTKTEDNWERSVNCLSYIYFGLMSISVICGHSNQTRRINCLVRASSFFVLLILWKSLSKRLYLKKLSNILNEFGNPFGISRLLILGYETVVNYPGLQSNNSEI